MAAAVSMRLCVDAIILLIFAIWKFINCENIQTISNNMLPYSHAVCLNSSSTTWEVTVNFDMYS